MNTSSLTAFLAALALPGLVTITTLPAEGSALLVGDSRSVAIDAPLDGDGSAATVIPHAGLGGQFLGDLDLEPAAADGSARGWGLAWQDSAITFDTGRLRSIDAALDTAAETIVDDPFAWTGDIVTAVARLDLLIDVLTPTTLTYRGQADDTGMFRFAGPGVELTALPALDTTLVLGPGRYALLFEAASLGFEGDFAEEAGSLSMTFSTPEPTSAALLAVAGAAVAMRRRRA